MAPSEFARHCLLALREEGADFEEAWGRMLRKVPRSGDADTVAQRREWIDVLQWCKPAFEAAYRGEPLEAVVDRRRAARAPEPEPPALAA